MTVLIASTLLTGPPAPAEAQAEPAITNTSPPTLSGRAVFRGLLEASPGSWSVSDASYSFQWLRDGAPIPKATGRSYTPVFDDLGNRVSVRVTATKAGYADGVARSASVRIRKKRIRVMERPRVTGVRRFERKLTASTGTWRPAPRRFRFQWLRDGEPIKDATEKTYRLGHRDVGHRVRVKVVALRRGHHNGRATSRWNKQILHRVGVRATVRYHVETRGKITADLGRFKRLAHASLNDPRGWRGAGIAFRRVGSGGSMTLVLSEASQVSSFSSGCSSQWSCRVGRYVIINQNRWKWGTESWRSGGGNLRGYRHMVVNHETGHWLGHGHRSCPAKGALAPVMQQQSISLQGCRHNPFPRPDERKTPRFH